MIRIAITQALGLLAESPLAGVGRATIGVRRRKAKRHEQGKGNDEELAHDDLLERGDNWHTNDGPALDHFA